MLLPTDCRLCLRLVVSISLIFLLLTLFFTVYLTIPVSFHYEPLLTVTKGIKKGDNDGNDTNPVVNLLTNDIHSTWQAVPNRKTIAFSAYFDERPKQPIVRVITESECQENRLYYCRLIFNHDRSAFVKATKELVDTSCDTIYGAFFLLCPLPEFGDLWYPTAVQIFDTPEPSEGLQKSMPYLSVVYSPNFNRSSKDVQYKHQLAVCIGRTWGWSDWFHFHFLVEFYLAQGATHIVFYHRSWSEDVEKLLRFYQRLGSVDIIAFPPAPKLFYGREDPNLARDFIFQNLQVNDCSYWLRGRAKFVVNIDSDEFILPRQPGESLLQLLRRLDVQDLDTFVFRNVIVLAHWPLISSLKSSVNSGAIERYWQDLSGKMWLNSFTCSQYYYGKSVNKPDTAVRVSLHEIHKSTKTGEPNCLFVPTSEAIKFHLRKTKISESFNLTRKTAAYAPCVDNFYEAKTSPFKLTILTQLKVNSNESIQKLKEHLE